VSSRGTVPIGPIGAKQGSGQGAEKKVTVPVGTGPLPETVAVNVKGLFDWDGFGDEVRLSWFVARIVAGRVSSARLWVGPRAMKVTATTLINMGASFS